MPKRRCRTMRPCATKPPGRIYHHRPRFRRHRRPRPPACLPLRPSVRRLPRPSPTARRRGWPDQGPNKGRPLRQTRPVGRHCPNPRRHRGTRRADDRQCRPPRLLRRPGSTSRRHRRAVWTVRRPGWPPPTSGQPVAHRSRPNGPAGADRNFRLPQANSPHLVVRRRPRPDPTNRQTPDRPTPDQLAHLPARHRARRIRRQAEPDRLTHAARPHLATHQLPRMCQARAAHRAAISPRRPTTPARQPRNTGSRRRTEIACRVPSSPVRNTVPAQRHPVCRRSGNRARDPPMVRHLRVRRRRSTDSGRPAARKRRARRARRYPGHSVRRKRIDRTIPPPHHRHPRPSTRVRTGRAGRDFPAGRRKPSSPTLFDRHPAG